MGGFGEKKQDQRGSSKKLQRLSENSLKAKSINDHIKGNLDDAEKGYRTFIKSGFLDADIFSNFALILEEKGDTESALKLYKRCVSLVI